MDRPEPITLQDVDYGGLEQATGFLLRLAQLRVFEHFYKAMEGQELRLGAMSALILIGHNPGIRHGILADALSIKLAHTTKMLKGLEARGLVRRHQPAYDRRSIELRLTDAGMALMRDYQRQIALHEDLSVAGLTERERAQLRRLLRKVSAVPACLPQRPVAEAAEADAQGNPAPRRRA